VTAPPTVQWKAGWREVGCRRIYFRSAWEANYSRYLQWLLERGEIKAWDHEPETFWFEAIKRGVRSYLPDFRVVERSGAVIWHEVKGHMTPRSKTALARMAKYHPHVKILVVDRRQYDSVKRAVSKLIPGWE
jgi:hypothetical protein